jgi:hypothetical protein
MPPFLETVIRYGLPIALAAFALAGAIFWFARRTGEIPPAAWAAIGLFCVLGVAALAAYARTLMPYHVVVTVLGPDEKPLENATVWSTAGGAPRRVAQGWELDVPASARPADGKLLVWAATDRKDATHSRVVLLSTEAHNTSVTIQTGENKNAMLAGRIVDNQGQPVAEVWLSMAGYADQSVVTNDDGRFRLAAHATSGEDVLMLVTVGRNPVETHWEKAGDQAITIQLGGSFSPPKNQ